MNMLKSKYLLLLWAGVLGLMLPEGFADRGHDLDHEDFEEEYMEEELNVSPRQALRFMREHFPHWYEEMKFLKEEEPEEYEEHLQDFAWFMQEYQELLEEEPAFAKLMLEAEIADHDLDVAVEEYHESESRAARKRAEEKIAELVERIFDLETELQKHEIEYLEREIQELRELLKRREANRERIIRDEIDEALEEFDDDEEEREDDEEDEEENED